MYTRVFNDCPITPVLELQSGAAGFQLSNPPVFECLSLKASLDVFVDTSMRELTTKSRILTGYLEILIEEYLTKEKREAAGMFCNCVTTWNCIFGQ